MGDMADDINQFCLDGQDSWERPMGFQKRQEQAGVDIGRCRVTYITEKAIRVLPLDRTDVTDDGRSDAEVWLAKSQLHSDSEINDTSLMDEEGIAVVSAWLASKKGWKNL